MKKQKKEVPAPDINPYNFSRPVKNLEGLGGRENEIQNIRSSLVGRQVSIALIGKRGIGKTSLINATGEICDELNYLPIHITLDEQLVSDDFLFFKELYSNLIQSLHERGKITDEEHTGFYQMVDNMNLIDAPYFLKFPKAYVNHFKNESTNVTRHYVHDDLAVLGERAGTQIVFLLDECDHLTTNKAILQILRSFLQKVDGYTLVLAGTSEFLGELNKVFESVVREIKKINIEGFKDERQTFDFIYTSLAEEDQTKLRFDRELFRDLHQIAEGNPYELKLVCHYLWQYAKRTNEIIYELSPLVLHEVANQMQTAVSEHYKFILDTNYLSSDDVVNVVKLVNNSFLTIKEKAVMEYLFEDEYSEEKITEFEKELRKKASSYTNLLEVNDDDKVVFKGGAFEMIYLKYLAQSKLKDRKDYWLNAPLPIAIFQKFLNVVSNFPEFEKNTNIYLNIGDLKNDRNDEDFFKKGFGTAYTYFTTNKTSFKSYTRREINEFDDFLDIYFKFNGQPSFRFITLQIDTLELKMRAEVAIEDKSNRELLTEFKEKYSQQLEDFDITLSEWNYKPPECSPNNIFTKLSELKKNNDDDNRLYLSEFIVSSGTRAVTKYENYELGKNIFENLCSVLGDNFSFRNNLGFINMHLSLDDAAKELGRAKQKLDASIEADLFVYNYNLASLAIYSGDLVKARVYLKEADKVTKITGKDNEHNGHYLHVFFIGDESKTLRSFDHKNYRIAIILMKAYLDYKGNPEKANIIENQVKKHYDEYKFDPIFLEGLCQFYKETGNNEEYERYEEEKAFLS